MSNLPVPSNGGPIYRFWACRPCGPAGWLALLLTKAGDVETNPGPTTLNKKVWICDICHKQIHVRKQISIRCNRIEHWVHLRCAGIRQAQYTDTWTCHLHRESRLTPHTDITPPHRSRPLSKPPTHVVLLQTVHNVLCTEHITLTLCAPGKMLSSVRLLPIPLAFYCCMLNVLQAVQIQSLALG